MALVPCPECQKEVSTEAHACPQCAYPFPGKRVVQADRPDIRMNTCSQCQGLISPHAQSCPHCGVSLIPHHQQPENQGEPVQEKLVCPHCGSSYTYTRKARQPLEPGAASEDLSSSVPTAIPGHPASPGLRRRSPLWQDPSALQVLSSPRYSHSKKKSIIVGLILLAVVVISVVFGAMWELRGLTPLETLLRWRM